MSAYSHRFYKPRATNPGQASISKCELCHIREDVARAHGQADCPALKPNGCRTPNATGQVICAREYHATGDHRNLNVSWMNRNDRSAA